MGMATESQFHVLAVDDSMIDRKLIERLLKTSSYQVTTVDSGSKALEFLGLHENDQSNPNTPSFSLNNHQVNLVITDYCMPGMTGYDLLKKIKESSSFKNIPVVIMSSENVPSRISRCLNEGAEEFFLKPVRLSDMDRLKPHIMKTKLKDQKSGIRRRRKGNYDCGKASMVIPSDNLQSDVGLSSCLPCYGSIIRDKISESVNPASGKEVSVLDDEGAQTGHDLCEKSCHSYEFDGSMVDSPVLEKYSSTLEHYMSNVQHNVQIVRNEEKRIKMLENELEEEKAAYAALYLVLEKERAAAASPGQDKKSSSLEHYMSKEQDNVQIVRNEENRIKMLENALEEEKAAYAALYLELEKERAAAASPGQDKKSSPLEHCMSKEQDNVQIVRNEENRIKMLENALEEEKAAYAALYLELEKETAAAVSPGQDKKSSSLEHYMSNEQDNVQIVRNEENCIKMLENALEEEKAAYAALYLELEKERAAAATAADEAMAMISRLQEEKASVEMEMRQYLRMIEERVSYDEEEMNILEEILIRRERENHFLEKELEAYRQMDLNGSDQSNDKPKLLLDEWGQRPPLSVETHEDPLQSESTISIVKKDEASNISSNYMITQTCIDTEEEEELEKNTEHKDQMHSDIHSSFYDTEPDVLDVHVVDDNIKLREEENEKLSSSLFSTVSNESRNSYLEFGIVAVPSTNTVSNCPRTSKTENENSDDGPTSQLSMFYNSRCKTLPFDSESDSSSAVHNEKLKIDNEIEILGERLRMVKHEKEKLTLFAENVESEKRQFKLLEEIANHLQQIKQLRNPVRGASLPPSSSKVSLRKRRCQSASWETCESS
ncbi:uncharacterized protein LOC133310859 isoform X2 [Gastrolobium bilobum]|uniref:uncharacterized protein LOC133310859 isoform X2 n=1 Tax=Gastrolobium bilobum TaxID=150636 RepID=UPI002AB286C0|nr:uncharacterized protein LOC133310859 isoform X2 [Gastrolobium bilobum]